jgi:hypothetical protein
MKEIKQTFNLSEVKEIVIKAYETGYCDGADSCNDFYNEDFKEYKDAEDYWNRYFLKKGLAENTTS